MEQLYATIHIHPRQQTTVIAKILRGSYYFKTPTMNETFEIARGDVAISVHSKFQLNYISEQLRDANIQFDIKLTQLAVAEIADEEREKELRMKNEARRLAAQHWANSLPSEQKTHLDFLLSRNIVG